MTRDDVRVLIGHTPNSGREVWTDPYRVESIVQVRIVPERVLVPHDQVPHRNWFMEWWDGFVYEAFRIDRKAWLHRAAFMGTQITMRSGDSGIVREPIHEVLAKLQTAYAIDWDTGGGDDERPKTDPVPGQQLGSIEKQD